MRKTATRILGLVGLCVVPAVLWAQGGSGTVTLVAAGDVEWSGTGLRGGGSVMYDDGGRGLAEGGWQPVPRLMIPEYLERLGDYGRELVARGQAETERAYGASYEHISTAYRHLRTHDLEFASAQQRARYPFERIAPLFREADIGFVNLETPLSDDAFRIGVFRTPTAFAEALADAGIDVVSTANNHMLDAERQGMFDTQASLESAGVAWVGSGADLEEARRPVILERGDVRIALLAYTQYENSGTTSFATPSRSGVAALDPMLIREDIARARDAADHVVLSFHWDIYHFDVSRSAELHPGAVEFARSMIDAGADAILGHHPHVPRAVEMYRGKPILYSMGHLIFSFGLPQWGDNYAARLTFSKERVEQLEILPVAGRWKELAQPYLLQGERAQALLNELQALSAHLGTEIEIVGDIGIVLP